MDYKEQFLQLEETLSEYELCVHCLSLGKDISQSTHLHQDIARSPIDSELVCLSCYNLQEKSNYQKPNLSNEREDEIVKIIDTFIEERGKSLDRFDDF